MADISRVIPDGAGEIRLSPGGSCQEASRFEVTLICINDAQFQRDTGSSVKLLLLQLYEGQYYLVLGSPSVPFASEFTNAPRKDVFPSPLDRQAWTNTQMNGMEKIVTGIEFFEFWQGVGDENVRYVVLPTVKCSRAVRRPISFGSSVIVLKDIELHKAGHLADDIRHMHKLVVRDVQEFQELEAGEVPGQLLYPVVLKTQKTKEDILFDQLVLQLALVEKVAFVGSHNKWDASTVFYAGAGT
ncbi:hypothetical protein M405DRAFT_884197 [Rhizopogon salebrosus TDB-379]|nr:hypothetical protein M405DRAFT_884197 [Rhizopogon salebrosus TDB-379]